MGFSAADHPQPAMPIGANCLVMLQSAKSVRYCRVSPFLVETFPVLMVIQIIGAGRFLPYKLRNFCPAI